MASNGAALVFINLDRASDRRAFMEAQGVDTSTLRRLPDRTVGLYMISLDKGERSFSYWRGQSAARMLADDLSWLDGILKDREMIHFSGITLAILPPEQRELFCGAVSRARTRGAIVSFDTNLRPRLWGSAEAMREGLTMGARTADIVLPSFDEEEQVFGDASPEATVERYRDLGAGGDAHRQRFDRPGESHHAVYCHIKLLLASTILQYHNYH